MHNSRVRFIGKIATPIVIACVKRYQLNKTGRAEQRINHGMQIRTSDIIDTTAVEVN